MQRKLTRRRGYAPSDPFGATSPVLCGTEEESALLLRETGELSGGDTRLTEGASPVISR